MPLWDLADLYPALRPSRARRSRRSRRRGAAHQARLPGQACRPRRRWRGLAAAIAAYESLSDTMGKLGSYAGLLYAADTSNPEKAKFYGDIQDKLTAISTDLIFFELELNKIEEAGARPRSMCRRSAATSRGSRTCARTSPTSSRSSWSACSTRKSLTSHSGWGRLFSETMTGLRFEVEGEKAPLTLEPTLNLLMSPDEGKRRPRPRRWRRCSRTTIASSR